jgi:2-methylisocitrate lyase-like PEP mutase family enzyme
MTSHPQQLRTLLSADPIVVAPGVFDGLSAKLVAQAGFHAMYASGGAIARSMGYPDLGLLSVSEVCARLTEIVDATDLPVIADADTGFGNALNTHRTVEQYARIGVAALHLEDQTFPKRCGHLDNKKLVPIDEMTPKIRAAKSAAQESGMVIIARTDAIAVEGFDAAIVRAKAYLEAGADMIFVEAPETLAQIEQIAQQITGWKLMNMFQGGKTPRVPLPALQQLGYRLVIIPSDLQRSAIFSMQKTLQAIHEHGDSDALKGQMVSFKERENIIGTADYLARDKHFDKS